MHYMSIPFIQALRSFLWLKLVQDKQWLLKRVILILSWLTWYYFNRISYMQLVLRVSLVFAVDATSGSFLYSRNYISEQPVTIAVYDSESRGSLISRCTCFYNKPIRCKYCIFYLFFHIMNIHLILQVQKWRL